MNDRTDTPEVATAPTCTAFQGASRVAHGSYAEVNRVLAALPETEQPLLVFDDTSGALVDRPWPAGTGAGAPTTAGTAADADADASGAAGCVGRPRLGVVAREVTLLPRHWDWLAQQRGGASAALRRLVDEARRTHAQADAQRLARERTYRVMSALAADWPAFEEASRALFAGDAAAFDQQTRAWPADARAHLAWLARDAFDTTG